jgi:hypothetical protein
MNEKVYIVPPPKVRTVVYRINQGIALFGLIIIGVILLCVLNTNTDNTVYKSPVAFVGYKNLMKDKLKEKLKAREGLTLKPYYDKKGYCYIGYGHLITNDSMCFFDFDTTAAELLLESDIDKAILECKRLKKEVTYSRVFRIFISGHL